MYIFLKVIRSEYYNTITVHATRRVLHSSTSRSKHVYNILLYIQLSIQAAIMFVEVCKVLFLCFWRDSPHWARTSSVTKFLYHTQRRTTFGRTPLDE